MKKFGNITRKLAAIAALTLAAGQATAAEVSAFGFTLGQTTTTEALKRGGTRSGVNKFSEGPMLKLPSSALGVDGIESATLIFNKDNSLAAILVDMQKLRFTEVYSHLKQKYALREERRPFVGNRYARFGAPGVTIELNAPHLSFSMSLAYQQDSFVQAFKQITAAESARNNARERNQF